jgi:glucan phosphoethanolaminetransferase (alkaline phosphatase superfamily)
MLRKIAVSILIELSIVSILVFYVNSFESIPYNVRELFAYNNPLLTIFLFSLALYAVFGAPVLLSSWLTVESWAKHLFPLLVVILGVVTWFLLRWSVPIESLHDVIGSPILNWGWEWESILRFTALFTASAVLLCGDSLIVHTYRSDYNLSFRPILHWSIHAALLLPIVHWMVVNQAATDNLTELMARGGDALSSLFLGLWIACLGLTTSLLVTHSVRRKLTNVIPLVTLLCSIPVGYFLLIFGTEDVVHKYGKVFSAMQFLLSQDRTNMASGFNLFLRYSIAHMCLIILIGISQYPFWEWKFRKMKMQDVHR